jgi:Zn finger protein HypA/HybF involved in hydrogenase expression
MQSTARQAGEHWRWQCVDCGAEKSRQQALTPDQRRRRRARVAANRRRRARVIREMLEAIKTHLPCEDCARHWPPFVMHFDHVRGGKTFGLSRAAAMAVSDRKLFAELEKCDLVCGNCHSIRHQGVYLTEEQAARRDEWAASTRRYAQ